MHLATIRNEPDNQLVYGLIQQNDAWIGYNDKVKEGSFEWVSGSSYLFQNWCDGEPNDKGIRGQDCAQIYGEQYGCWDDLKCNEERAYVCSRD